MPRSGSAHLRPRALGTGRTMPTPATVVSVTNPAGNTMQWTFSRQLAATPVVGDCAALLVDGVGPTAVSGGGAGGTTLNVDYAAGGVGSTWSVSATANLSLAFGGGGKAARGQTGTVA